MGGGAGPDNEESDGSRRSSQQIEGISGCLVPKTGMFQDAAFVKGGVRLVVRFSKRAGGLWIARSDGKTVSGFRGLEGWRAVMNWTGLLVGRLDGGQSWSPMSQPHLRKLRQCL